MRKSIRSPAIANCVPLTRSVSTQSSQRLNISIPRPLDVASLVFFFFHDEEKISLDESGEVWKFFWKFSRARPTADPRYIFMNG